MQIQALSKAVHQVTTQLQPLGVAVIYLFGSRAQGLEGPMSDYDFGILLRDPLPPGPKRRQLYLALHEILEDIINQPTNIDIVFLHDAPMHLRLHVIRHGVILFETDARLRGRFHEHTMMTAADFAFHRERFEAAILARIP